MSMLREHCQSIAEDLAIQEDNMLFQELPACEQKRLFDKAREIADNEIKKLTEK